MAAEDPSDLSVVSPGGGEDTALGAEDQTALPTAVCEWLAVRIACLGHEINVFASAPPGRWLVRVDLGGGASSSIDVPVRDRTGATDVASAVRRWARSAGHSVRADASHGNEVRLALVPAGASRS